jgi:hypothetical protein
MSGRWRGYGNHQDSWSPRGYPSPDCSQHLRVLRHDW